MRNNRYNIGDIVGVLDASGNIQPGSQETIDYISPLSYRMTSSSSYPEEKLKLISRPLPSPDNKYSIGEVIGSVRFPQFLGKIEVILLNPTAGIVYMCSSNNSLHILRIDEIDVYLPPGASNITINRIANKCYHEYVNVGFYSITLACKHCGESK